MTSTCPSVIKNKQLWNTLPFLNGQFIEFSKLSTFDIKNPSSGKVIATLPSLRSQDVHDASEIASNAFRSWKSTTVIERSKIVKKMADLMEVYRDDLAAIITLEAGKPLAEAKGEVSYAQSYFEFYSEECKRPHGEVLQSATRGRRFMTIKQPIGPVGLVTPWNFPCAMITRKVGPALAAGCTVVLKPSEETPLSALALCAIAQDAGLPAGVLNCVPVGREHVKEAGVSLCTSERLRMISFTGSTAVGKTLMRDSASTVKRVALELGGNAPFIVCEDADLDVAVTALMAAKFRNSGQACIASNRVLVHSKVYNQFAEKLAATVKSKLICGDGFSPSSTLGPLINEQGLNKIIHHVSKSISLGATALTGGSVETSLNTNGGTFHQPTVLVDMKVDMPPFHEETFGPVVPLLSFDHDDDAIAIANDTKFGLAGYLCTRDLNRMWRMAEAMEVGMVGVNEGFISSALCPFGGVKESGLGREGASHGLDEYTEMKAIIMGGM